ncbi:hypothetical protein Plec18167_009618 [Paecilomyces lecythidis]|uniref:Kinesin light chain n=1 Tax=Paecilomyces lecythidis TaxID=3004212 RepID=A0ABR3WN74_9EURO
MEGLGAAASVIAVVDIATKVIVLCSTYLTAVAKARYEISRLQKHIESLQTFLWRVKHLLESPDGRLLATSHELNDALQKCKDELQQMGNKLKPRTMQRAGLRALKWPFKKGDVESLVASLTNHRDTIATSLQIDQTTLLLQINKGMKNLSLQTVVDISVARKPHFMMPFPRDLDYVERPSLQAWIEQQYASRAGRIALVGLGGFGKSQIAIEFAHKTHLSSPDISVFWVHGGTKAKFEESYRSLANTLMLPSRHDPNINILQLVRDWLQKDDIASWLMILDNADNPDVFFSRKSSAGSGQESMASFLPKTDRGKILITSRTLNAAEKLTGSHKLIQTVPIMNSSEALQLLQNKLSDGSYCDDAATSLVRALDFIPLAIDQAAAFINRRAPRVSIKSYLDDFGRSERHRTSLLSSDAGDLRRDEGVSNSVVVTWQVTFEQIRQERPTAAGLLSLMSFFHFQNIPEDMLSHYEDVVDSGSSNGSVEGFEDDLDVLRAYSLVNMSVKPGFLEMHSLVQSCTKAWLLQSGLVKRFKDIFFHLGAMHFPNGTFETWARCQDILPHVQPLLHEQPTDESSILDWSQVLTNMSQYMLMIGDYSTAECGAHKAVRARKKILGDEHPDMLASMANLASIYRNQGRWAEAEGLDVQVMETSLRVLGDEHPDTLTSIANLASTFWNQGRWAEAEGLGVQVIDMKKRVLGDEHPSTLASMANLASTFWNQGQWAKAERLGVQVMNTRKRVLGDEHPSTLASIANLASTYRNQGRWAEAEGLDVQVMEISLRVLGDEHPDTLTSIANLASTFWNQGRWAEAEGLGVQVMDTRKRVLGDEHPDTLTSMANLASTFWNQGRWAEAERLEVQVIDMRKRVLGDEHPDTLTSMVNLASTYRDQGRWAEAEGLGVQVMETSLRVLGDEHPDTLTSMANLASTFWNQGRWAEAERLDVQVMETSLRVLGDEHPDTLTSMANLASTYRDQGRWAEAERLDVQVMETSLRVLGDEHPDMLASMANLASTYRDQGRWAEAERLGVQVMETSLRVLGDEHPDMLASMANLASTYRDQGRWAEAERLDVQVMETSLRVLGEEHPDTLTSFNNLAFTLYGVGRIDEALMLMRDCVSFRQRILGREHPYTLSSSDTLEKWKQDHV